MSICREWQCPLLNCYICSSEIHFWQPSSPIWCCHRFHCFRVNQPLIRFSLHLCGIAKYFISCASRSRACQCFSSHLELRNSQDGISTAALWSSTTHATNLDLLGWVCLALWLWSSLVQDSMKNKLLHSVCCSSWWPSADLLEACLCYAVCEDSAAK